MTRTKVPTVGMSGPNGPRLAPTITTIVALFAFVLLAVPSADAASVGLTLKSALSVDTVVTKVKGGKGFEFGGGNRNRDKQENNVASRSESSTNGKKLGKNGKKGWKGLWKRPRNFEQRTGGWFFEVDNDRKRKTQFKHAKYKAKKIHKILYKKDLPYYKRKKLYRELARLKRIIKKYKDDYGYMHYTSN